MKKHQHQTLWRWHFFAGLYVLPFMLMLTITGLVMMFYPQIEQWQYPHLVQVDANQSSSPLSATQQLDIIKKSYPGFRVRQYQPPQSASRSARFKIVSRQTPTQIIFINPYSGEILGQLNARDTWYSIADDIHGTLMLSNVKVGDNNLGKLGDALIELSAGFSLLLLISGIYLYWPKKQKQPIKYSSIKHWLGFRFANNKHGNLSHSSWKSIHASLGIWLSIILVFFVLTGMAWTGIWGQQLVQPWSSFPTEKRSSSWQSDSASILADTPQINYAQINHAQLNTENNEEVAWNLELAAVPQSRPQTKPQPRAKSQHQQEKAISLPLEQIMQQGQQLGFDYFRVALPQTPNGVYTLMSVTTSGDVVDPRKDRTVHIDQYSGQVLADIGWQDYNPVAKSMAAGIALHKGQVFSWNLWLNTLACVLLAFSSLAGLVMWFKRRVVKKQSKTESEPKPSLTAPAIPNQQGMPKTAAFWFVLTGILFPPTGIAMLLFYGYEQFQQPKND